MILWLITGLAIGVIVGTVIDMILHGWRVL